MHLRIATAGLIILAALTHTAFGQNAEIGDIAVTNAFIRATVPGAPVAGGYLVIQNNGSETDRLAGGSAKFAERLEFHTMSMEGGVMKMRRLDDGIEIPAGETIVLKPGGMHIMFMGPTGPLTPGDALTVTLMFEKAGAVDLSIPVKPFGYKPPVNS